MRNIKIFRLLKYFLIRKNVSSQYEMNEIEEGNKKRGIISILIRQSVFFVLKRKHTDELLREFVG